MERARAEGGKVIKFKRKKKKTIIWVRKPGRQEENGRREWMGKDMWTLGGRQENLEA